MNEANNNAMNPAKFRNGRLVLTRPIRSRSKDIAELKYDFDKLTNWDLVEAMDADMSHNNAFRVSMRQAMHLFAAAAAKCTEDVDQIDILEQLSADDAIKAQQVATLFFVTSSREGDKRILSE